MAGLVTSLPSSLPQSSIDSLATELTKECEEILQQGLRTVKLHGAESDKGILQEAVQGAWQEFEGKVLLVRSTDGMGAVKAIVKVGG